MRLIDADALARNILSQTIMNETDAKIMDRYLYCINNQPTAYNIDEVVEELNLCFRREYNGEDEGFNYGIRKAIAVVCKGECEE